MIRLIKFLLKIRKKKNEWTKLNKPYGKELGYPDCCIKSFCDLPPVLIRWLRKKNIQIPYMKECYNASFIDGYYTGFIPCHKHAKQILKGKITLYDLIKDRNILFNEFPNEPTPFITKVQLSDRYASN